MTSYWARGRLKSPASRLFTRPFSRAQFKKKNIKAPRHWPFGEPVNSPHKWPVTRKMFPLDDIIVLKRHKYGSAHCGQYGFVFYIIPIFKRRELLHFYLSAVKKVLEWHGKYSPFWWPDHAKSLKIIGNSICLFCVQCCVKCALIFSERSAFIQSQVYSCVTFAVNEDIMQPEIMQTPAWAHLAILLVKASISQN